MNDKLCKRLRREAREKSVGMKDRRLIDDRQRVSQKKGGGFVFGIKNDPDTTRGIYRQLKRAAQ